MCKWTNCRGALSLAGGSSGSSPSETMAMPHPNDTPIPALHTSTCEATISTTATASDGQPQSRERFSSFVDDKKLALLSKGMTPANTDKSTKWALSTLTLGKMQGTGDIPQTGFRMTYLCSMTYESASFQICLETRKTNGQPYYPPKTIHQLLCGLLRQIRGK